MSIIEAIILGLLQGLTEFIPVSSSGHLLIAHEIFGTTTNTLAFDVALHVGTLIALIYYFWRDILTLAKNVLTKNKEGALARLLVYATLPAALLGFVFSDFIDDHLREPIVVVITLSIIAVLMIIADKLSVSRKKTDEVSTGQGLSIGFAQALALVPGVSRSGITITTGVLAGLTKKEAARFSFLLAVPIISGSALGIFLQESDGLSTGGWQIAFGMIAACISGLFAIKFMLGIIEKTGLTPFAYYRFIVAVLVLIFLV